MDFLATLVPPAAWKPALLAGAVIFPLLATVCAVIEPRLTLLARPSILLAVIASLCVLGLEGVNDREGELKDRQHGEQVVALKGEVSAANDQRANDAAASARRMQELEKRTADMSPPSSQRNSSSGSSPR